MVTDIVIDPSDVGRYLHVAVLVPEPATVLTAVHPEIARLLTRNVTLDGMLTRAAIGLVCRKVALIAVSPTKGSVGRITLVTGVALPIVNVSSTSVAAA
jgi:hypothetical protein